MPLIQKTVYFREEDAPKWDAIVNKAQWLHDRLNDVPVTKERPPAASKPKPVVHRTVNPSAKFHEKPTSIVTNLSAERLANGTCKVHGLPLDSRGRCLQVGCKTGM